jgi:hypothetical protein
MSVIDGLRGPSDLARFRWLLKIRLLESHPERFGGHSVRIREGEVAVAEKWPIPVGRRQYQKLSLAFTGVGPAFD